MTKKLIAPIIGTILMAVFTTVQEAMTDNRIDSQEWVLVGLGVLMAFNVWATANLPQYERMKTYVATAIVIAGALHTFIVGGVSMQEWVNMIVLALSALGVAAIKQPITTVTIDGETVPSGRTTA
jgi:hypothetical protein